jgi:hypothetical protein
MLNSLANHGYIPRDGRQIRLSELKSALTTHAGLSSPLAALLSHPVYNERRSRDAPKPGLLSVVWEAVKNPWTLMSHAGLREVGQVDGEGVACLNLDQLARPGVVEHDVSLTRRDYGEGDNITVQRDLVEALLDSSSDGGKTISIDDLIKYRATRMDQQKSKNPRGVKFGPQQQRVALGEVAFTVGLFGDGERVGVERLRAWFGEERLPMHEGWKAERGGWFGGFGIVRLFRGIAAVRRRMEI